ncbi:MAG: hypothetical protein IPM82_05645 [Saprospiraceae bacterium]|nr:hypothetical protein [Saprospiraceae bacterium]
MRALLIGNDHGKLLVWDIRENSITPVESCRQAMPFRISFTGLFSAPKTSITGQSVVRGVTAFKDLCITDFWDGNVVDETPDAG